MMDTTGAADYASAAAFLDRARLPAYISFVERASAHGVSREEETRQRISVRTRDGAIVAVTPPVSTRTPAPNDVRGGNPFGKRAFFQPACYEAASENQTAWHGRTALRFDLRPACQDGRGPAELYADPQTFRPFAIAAHFSDPESSAIGVEIEVQYTTIAQYTVPSSMDVHVSGRGWLGWLREHGQVTYSEYEFSQGMDPQGSSPASRNGQPGPLALPFRQSW